MGSKEPYHLTLDELNENPQGCCAKTTCVVCGMEMDVSWYS